MQYSNSRRPPRPRFDGAAFYAALDTERQARGRTWKEVAEESGVSASTLTRMGQGKRPDLDGLAALVAWSGLDPNLFMAGSKDGRQPRQPDTLTMVTTFVRHDPGLSVASAAALGDIFRAAYQSLRQDPRTGVGLSMPRHTVAAPPRGTKRQRGG
ncbi:MAG: helix-turn-helix transcriptional regulator [Chloroflexi bacterium]|nr:MAG: helix-turn-helix transcriptional regulator [Chloroflexota bacterium]